MRLPEISINAISARKSLSAVIFAAYLLRVSLFSVFISTSFLSIEFHGNFFAFQFYSATCLNVFLCSLSESKASLSKYLDA